MLDEIEMQAIVQLGRDKGRQKIMRLFDGCILWNPAEAARDAKDVRVDRKEGLLEAKEQNDRRRFGTDAGNVHQPLARLIGGHAFQETQLDAAALPADVPQRLLDARSLLSGQAGRMNGSRDLRDRRIAHLIPPRKAAPQLGERVRGLNVGRRLAKDGRDELTNRVAPVAARLAVQLFEPRIHLTNLGA